MAASELTVSSQKRFKKIVEDAGFALVEGKVVLRDRSGVPFDTTPKPTRTQTKKNSGTPASKKRKIVKDEAPEEDEGVADVKDEASADTAEEESA